MVFERKKIGEILVEMGAITPSGKFVILEAMDEKNLNFGQTGIELRMFNEDTLALAISRQFNLEYNSLEDFAVDPELLASMPDELPLECLFLPIEERETGLVLAVGDPTDVTGFDDLEILLDRSLILQVASPVRINQILEHSKKSQNVLRNISEDFNLQLVKETDLGEEVFSIEKSSDDTSPIIRLIDSTLYDALNKRTSDIHIESGPDGVDIKYRIDGVLYKATETLDDGFQSPIISRIKVMSELDISERRIPQDGRFKVRLEKRNIDFRVSIMPSIFGEDAVIRILDKNTIASDFQGLTLEALGYSDREMERFRKKVREPYGMVLVTGPTGSGKTTSLYAALSEINCEEEKIVTIEDPVEYQLRGVVQIPVNEKKGLTFARGLRSILRHDPDRIMVGEIRDSETAQIAVQSALTGHLVFTTVHANNVFDVLGRFLHMGLDPFSFVSSLNCVLAQRLVRKICDDCKSEVKMDRAILEESGFDAEACREAPFFEGKGCEKCNGTGYYGRSAIIELLDMDDRMRQLIMDRSPISLLKQEAQKSGMKFLRDSAIEKVFGGLTTLREINRVTFAEKAGRA